MATRVDGAEVRCKLCGALPIKSFNYRDYFHANDGISSSEANRAALRHAKLFAREHAQEEHGIELDTVPYEPKVFPKRYPSANIYVTQYGRQQ